MGFQLGQRLNRGQHGDGYQLPHPVIQASGIAHIAEDIVLQDLHELRISSLIPGGRRVVLAEDRCLQFLLAGVGHRPLGALGYLVGLVELDAPIQEQAKPHLHRMDAGLGHDKAALWHGLQLVGSHEGPLDHLQALGWVVLSPADGAAHHRAAPQGFRQFHRCLAGWGKSSGNQHLAVVHNDLRTLPAVVLLELTSDRLHDGYQHQPSGAGGAEHQLQRLDWRT